MTRSIHTLSNAHYSSQETINRPVQRLMKKIFQLFLHDLSAKV